MNAAEINAYESLQDLQGDIIPWYYGHGVRLNNRGDSIPLMLLEYIEGETLHKWLLAKHSNQELDSVEDSLNIAVSKFHSRGWSHNCIYSRNIIFGKDLSVILIDLQRAEQDADRSYDLEHVERIWKNFKREIQQGRQRIHRTPV